MANEQDKSFYKIYLIQKNPLQKALLFLFLKGCRKPTNQGLKDYLQSPPNNMSNTYFKKIFKKDQRKTLDADPSGNSYDITLLSTSIDEACTGLTPELKESVQKIRRSRNSLIHENPQFDKVTAMNKAKELQIMGEELYLDIGKTYAVDVCDEIDKMKDEIREIMKADLPVPDIDKYRQDLSKLRDAITEDFRVMGQEELKKKSNFWTMTDPIAFLTQRETIPVESIFTRIELVLADLLGKNANDPVRYEDLLNLLAENKKTPDVLILEGQSGSGKTTLTKILFSYWMKCLCVQGYVSPVIGLDNFDFVFPYACSDSSISSFLDLIKAVLPQTADAFEDDDILRSARQLKMFIMVDAADDLNSESKRLLRDIIEIQAKSCGNLRIICTTRPQALKDLQKLINNRITAYTRITGISPDDQEKFLKCLHDEMKRNGQSIQETEGLVNFHRRSKVLLGEHFKYPIVLNFVTYLWAADPSKVNGVTTVSTLYNATHELNQKKLHDRLSKHPKVRDDKDLTEIEESSDKFLGSLYEESLKVIGLGKMMFPEKCEKNLKKAADYLPHSEMCGAFLNIDQKWTVNGLETQLTAPHKSLVEFYGACHTCNVITGKFKTDHQCDLETKYGALDVSDPDKIIFLDELNKSKTVEGVIDYNHRKISSDSTPLDISKYQNMLVLSIGLLAGQGREVLHRFYPELIEILQQTNINDASFWLHVLNEANCDLDVAKLVAEKMTGVDKLKDWRINDNNIRPATALLKSMTPNSIVLTLLEDQSTSTDLKNLINKISGLNCNLEFNDHHSYKKLQRSADSYMQLINRCNVSSLWVAVADIEILPPNVQYLSLGLLKDSGGKVIDPGVGRLTQHCKQLEYLGLHISASTITDAPLPRVPDDVGHTELLLSQVDDQHLQAAVSAARRLQPTRGFIAISFPGCQLDESQLCHMVGQMEDAGIIVRAFFAIPPHLYHKGHAKLKEALRNTWNCSLGPVSWS